MTVRMVRISGTYASSNGAQMLRVTGSEVQRTAVLAFSREKALRVLEYVGFMDCEVQ